MFFGIMGVLGRRELGFSGVIYMVMWDIGISVACACGVLVRHIGVLMSLLVYIQQ